MTKETREVKQRGQLFILDRNGLAVPLIQLEVIHGAEQTKEAVKDWHYWINRGYAFG